MMPPKCHEMSCLCSPLCPRTVQLLVGVFCSLTMNTVCECTVCHYLKLANIGTKPGHDNFCSLTLLRSSLYLHPDVSRTLVTLVTWPAQIVYMCPESALILFLLWRCPDASYACSIKPSQILIILVPEAAPVQVILLPLSCQNHTFFLILQTFSPYAWCFKWPTGRQL